MFLYMTEFDVFIYDSEFEEHQPVSVISRSPLESSSAAASAIDAVEDAVFSNFCTVYDVVMFLFSMFFG